MACAKLQNTSVKYWRKHRFRILFGALTLIDSNLAALRRKEQSAMACAKLQNTSVKYWHKHRFKILFATDLNLALARALHLRRETECFIRL